MRWLSRPRTGAPWAAWAWTTVETDLVREEINNITSHKSKLLSDNITCTVDFVNCFIRVGVHTSLAALDSAAQARW